MPAFTSTDREVCFKHFSPLVEHLTLDQVERWPGDSELIRVNATRAHAMVRDSIDAFESTMLHLNMDEIREIPSLALALAFADARVVTPASAKEIAATQRRLRPMRRLAIQQLTILAEMGLIADPSQVDAIVRGKGGIDEARDGVACVAVFRENAAAVKNKHPFDDAWLDGLAEVSNWLLAQLKPSSAVPTSTEKSPEAVVRDQLYTELVRRHGQARKVAIEVLGWKQAEESFPALGSRERSAPKEEPQPQPT